MNFTTRHLLATTAAMLALAGCASTQGPKTIADTLRGAGPYTVFAPSDDAFKAVPKATMDALAKDKELLKSVLSYHVLPGKVTADAVKNGNAKTVQGDNVALARAGTFVTVEDALVTQANVDASNGVVHVIDKVLMPPKKK